MQRKLVRVLIESTIFTSHDVCRVELHASFTHQGVCLSDVYPDESVYLIGLHPGEHHLHVTCGLASTDVTFPVSSEQLVDIGFVTPVLPQLRRPANRESRYRDLFLYAALILSILEVLLIASLKS